MSAEAITGGTLALVGDGPAAEAILDGLAGTGWTPERIEVLAARPEPGATLAGGGRSVDVTPVADFDFSAADITIFVDDPACAEAFAAAAAEAGCSVIEATGLLADRQEVPQAVAGLDVEGVLADAIDSGLVSVPPAPAALLARLLVPLHRAAGLRAVDATALRGMGAFGSAAVEELAGQTAGLLNAQEREPEYFDAPIAFNLLPEPGLEGGSAGVEAAMAETARRLLAIETLPVTASAVRVPVFHGDGLALHLTLQEELTPERAAEVLREAGITAAAGPLGPDPRGIAEGGGIHVGRLRTAPDDPRRLALWAVADPVKGLVADSALAVTGLLARELLD
ncbi:MAG: Asd/ArgC dimerization domain-containing protein [Thiohalospira sp.]